MSTHSSPRFVRRAARPEWPFYTPAESERKTLESREIGQIISQVSEIGTSISGAVEEQSVATREVAANIDGVATAADETGRSSSSMLAVSQELSQQASDLGERVDQFLVNVRAM